jgi:hypothetical protein
MLIPHTGGRAERCTVGARDVCLSSGSYYMEVELLKMGLGCSVRLGFACASLVGGDDCQDSEARRASRLNASAVASRPAAKEDHCRRNGLGDDAILWGVDGEGFRWAGGGEALAGPKWKEGDVIGLALDLARGEGSLTVLVNGVYPEGGPVSAGGVEAAGWLFPALSAKNMRVSLNFGSNSFKHAPLLYPGQVGDRFCETAVMLQLKPFAGTPASAAQSAAERITASVVLNSDEERARAAQVLPQCDCIDWEVRGESVLGRPAQAIKFKTDSLEQKLANEGNALVGVVLPMPPAHAKKQLAGLQAALADCIGLPDSGDSGGCEKGVQVLRVWSRTTTYCDVPSVSELRKHLEELSQGEFEAAARYWGVSASDCMPRTAVVKAAVDEFVRRELRVDFAAALRDGFGSLNAALLDAALDTLLRDWNLTPAASREQRMAAAAGGLDSVARWEAVASWVGLFQVRMQGRKRAGICKLEKRGQRYGLQRGESLALYLYTGPEYFPMNGILRGFPANIKKLLAGNTMCTTLFCISSALKKVGQASELPRSGKVYRGLGRLLLPSQFWVPHGKPAWRGGVEKAFMSTTADKSVALFYANGRGTVVEISVGRIQIGGDISFLSMVSAFLS